MAAATDDNAGIFVKAEASGTGRSGPRFPQGLKVIAVDDDPVCLKVIESMLQKCDYHVTTCSTATQALQLLRDEANGYDLVLSDVYMPDMDGFKLLEIIGLEMDLPVIMMSSNGETTTVLRGVTHGAVDFLIKPVRIEELRNVWQHVLRRRRDISKDTDGEDGSPAPDCLENGTMAEGRQVASGADVTRKRCKPEVVEGAGDGEDDVGASGGEGRGGGGKDGEEGNASKKQRVVWSVDMHQQFVNAVNSLGIDKAVPKKILELMDVEGLTRENVASHLQKYRLYLKRVSGVQATGGRHIGFKSGHPGFLGDGCMGNGFNVLSGPMGLPLPGGVNPLAAMAMANGMGPLGPMMMGGPMMGMGLPGLPGGMAAMTPAQMMGSMGGLAAMAMPPQMLMQGLTLQAQMQQQQAQTRNGAAPAGPGPGGLVAGSGPSATSGTGSNGAAAGATLPIPSSSTQGAPVSNAANAAASRAAASAVQAASASAIRDSLLGPIPGSPLLSDSGMHALLGDMADDGHTSTLGPPMDFQPPDLSFGDMYVADTTMGGGAMMEGGLTAGGDVGKPGEGMDDLFKYFLA